MNSWTLFIIKGWIGLDWIEFLAYSSSHLVAPRCWSVDPPPIETSRINE